MPNLLDPNLPHIAFLFAEVLGTPAWMWLGFLGLVLGLLAFDLGVLHRKSHAIGIRESLTMSAGYIALGLSFGAWVWWSLGAASGMAYVTGFALEKALAMDNVFVIAMIFAYFAVPRVHQHRVLFWGILGVIVLRGLMIGVGAAVIAQAHWVLTLFAVFLVATGIKMLVAADKPYDIGGNRLLKWVRWRCNVTAILHGERFFVRRTDAEGRRRWFMTPLFLALVTIEIADKGTGMDGDFVRNRLFQPFASTKSGGFGIGAFEARSLITAMNGRIAVDSRPGQGTVFTISLPGAEPAHEAMRKSA